MVNLKDSNVDKKFKWQLVIQSNWFNKKKMVSHSNKDW